MADLWKLGRDVVEVPPARRVRGSLIDDVFVNTTSEDRQLAMDEEVMQTLPGETVTYVSTDSVKCDNVEVAENYPMEFINSFTPTGIPPHHIHLKVGCIIMLLCNLALHQELCNDTRLEVINLHQNSVEAKLTSGN